jgi:hypothetical protein
MLANEPLTIYLLAAAMPVGLGATAIMDAWALFLRLCFAVPFRNYDMVGRWVGHMTRGTFMHLNIADSSPIAGEAAIGWTVHYLVGIGFSWVLLMLWGVNWSHQPTLAPALIVGLATVAFPFFIMQPCFGAGMAASKLPEPGSARLRSLMAHVSFGAGLYLSALIMAHVVR